MFLAVGCTNLIPPEDAWIKREGDKIIIGCYTSRQTWQLRCHDGRWTGVVSNCSKGFNNNLLQKLINDFFLPRDALHNRGLCRDKMSVCLSVSPMPVFIVSKRLNIIIKPHNSRVQRHSSFPYQTSWQHSDGDPPNRGVTCGVWKIQDGAIVTTERQ